MNITKPQTKKLKSISIAFIIAELLDIITTVIGVFYLGATELNPIMSPLKIEQMILIKLLIILIVVYAVQKTNFGKIGVIIPIIAGLPVLWNIFNLVMELIY